MAKTNRKPGVVKQNNALRMKRQDNNILHSKVAKIIFIFMILAFIGIPLVQLIMLLFPSTK